MIVRVQKMIRNVETRDRLNRRRYKVDKAKLYDAIWGKGYNNISDFSIDAGLGESTISNSACNGHMSKTMIDMIESAGIPPNVYVLDGVTTQAEDKHGEKVVVEQTMPTEDAMYRATYTAIMNTWSFIREDLKAIIKEALSE